jgi:hypothetical protein
MSFTRFASDSLLTTPGMRRAADLLLLFSGLLLAQIGVSFIRRTAGIDLVIWPWLLLGIGALTGGVGLRRMDRWLPDVSAPARPAQPTSTHRRWLGWGMMILGLALTGWIVWRLWPDYRNWQGTVFPWLLAMIAMALAGLLLRTLGEPAADYGPRLKRDPQVDGGARPRLPAPWRRMSETDRWQRPLEIIPFVLILILAIFLRLHRLGEIPAAIYVDETNASLDALRILEGGGASPFGTGWYETPNGYIYYMAGIYKLLGANYGSLKAASLLPAILTIPAVYWLGRYLFGSVAGLAAMFLLAISRWHMTLSRWGWNELMPPLFQILGTYFLIRGLRERRALDFALGGLISGLSVYTYLSSRLALLTLALFAIYWLAVDPDGPVTACKRHIPGLVLFGAAALVAMAPIGVTYATQPFLFLNRSVEISIFRDVQNEGSWWPLRQNLWRHIQLFYQEGDPVGRQNLPGEPQTDPITGMLLAVGLGYALLTLRDRRRGLLWLWLVIALAGGFLSELRVQYPHGPDYIVSPNSYRTLAALIAVVLIGGDLLARLARGFFYFRPESGISRLINGAVGLLLIVPMLSFAAAWEISLYFGRQANSPEVQASFNQMETRVAQQVIDALDDGAAIYLSPNFYNFSPLRFLVYDAVRGRMDANPQIEVNPLDHPPFGLARPEVDLPIPANGSPSAAGGALLLLDLHYAAVADYIRTLYPNAEIGPVMGSTGAPLFLRVWLPEADLAAQQGLKLTRVYADGKSETRPVLDLTRPPTENLQRLTWEGSLRLERSDLYDFAVENATLLIDDEPWDQPRYLGIQDEPDQRGAVSLRWRTPAHFGEEVTVDHFFLVSPPQQGLTGFYYRGENWEGEPILQQVTPFLLLAWPRDEPLPHPFSATFVGSLQIETPGLYRFRLNADDGVRLTLADEILGEALVPDRPNQIWAEQELSPGLYPIRIDYFQRHGGSALEFFWQPPGEEEGPVPPAVLHPNSQVNAPDRKN